MVRHKLFISKMSLRLISNLFSPDPPVSSTNKSDRHDIAEILLKVAVKTLTPPPPTFYRAMFLSICRCCDFQIISIRFLFHSPSLNKDSCHFLIRIIIRQAINHLRGRHGLNRMVVGITLRRYNIM